MELEAEIKAANAELSVLEQHSDGMNSYISKARKNLATPTNELKPQETQVNPVIRAKILQARTLTPTVHKAVEETENPPAQLPEQNNFLIQFLQKQNDISDLLIQQNAAQLPAREIPIFDGDPLKFKVFI